jgi:hypothetical protein
VAVAVEKGRGSNGGAMKEEGGRWGKEGRGVILRVSLGRGRWAVGLASLIQLCRVSIFRPTTMLFFQKLL